jgi:hypothetical protein
MASVTYHVLPFDRDEEGALKPGEPKEAPSAEMAQRRPRSLLELVGGDFDLLRRSGPARYR